MDGMIITDEMIERAATKRFHRIRHYQHSWSNFDLVELCHKPEYCWGCEFKHPFCDESGRDSAALSGKEE